MSLPERVHLVDSDGVLVRAWSDAFRDLPTFGAQRRDYFEVEADAMVSPANSFGVMDGGLDMAWLQVSGVGAIPDFAAIHAAHGRMRTET